MRQNRIKAWRDTTYSTMLQKHDSEVRMMRQRASTLQKQMKKEKGFIVLRAYYGLRTDIERHLDLHLVDR